jgi:signal transduction histidine kinase/ActR/RegA family two-component response regulator
LKTAIASAEDHAAEQLAENIALGMDCACTASALIVVAIATLVFVGWLFMIEELKRVGPTFVAMNPMTAIGLFGAGIALFLLRSRKQAPGMTGWLGRVIGLGVAIIGCLKLYSLLGGSDLGIDQWLFRSELAAAGTTMPNRMAPNTAFNFVLAGLALFLLDVEIRGHRPSELLSIVSGISGLLALVGYIYRAPMFYGVGYAIPMALHSSIGFLILAVGTLVARPRGAIMAIVSSDTAGGMVARRLLPLAVILPIGLGLLRVYGQASGLFEAEFGTALYSTALVLVLLVFIWAAARILFDVDTERRYIERWQSEKLERTVQERTRRLEHALQQLKETQQQILQRERLHALGAMASGVTHDFNNALSVIIGFGEMALRECEKGDETARMKQFLQPMVVAALDGARVVTRLREFYRAGGREEPRSAVDLNMLIEEAVTITQPKWRSESLGNGVKIEIKTELGDIPPAAGDPAELREALANLVFNAIDAMPAGGTITLRTRHEKERIVMEISDTGMGMSKEVQRKCLDPFFTTKGKRGTGMGLAMVYGIVERHRGTLHIESEEGRGTAFVISLPPHESPETVDENRASEVARPLRVLIADDQPLLCEILAEYLKNDCHTVISAHDGREALEMFKREPVDVVITDQAMPEMTGNQLAHAIKTQSPSTPVILLTGFGEASGDGEHAIDHVLSKPVSLIDLRNALVRVSTQDPAMTVA